MASLLLDTHALFWLIYDINSLSPEAVKAIQDPANEVNATLLSAQDIAVKITSGRWAEALDLLEYFEDRVRGVNLSIIRPQAEDYSNLLHLPSGQGDPVDRLIYAQALGRDMILVTSDGNAKNFLPAASIIFAGSAPSVKSPRQRINPTRGLRRPID